MRRLSIAVLLFAIIGSLGACDRNPKASASKNAAAVDPVAVDLDRMEAGIRMAAANKRIDDLERKVGALEATPETINLDLLTQRVTALEVKSAGAEAVASQAVPVAKADQAVSGTPRPGSEPRRSPAGKVKLTLPELENHPRLATPAETKAFSGQK
ncbi:hypothetical protein [Sphingomonas sp. Leaf208]|uniref:hypothetical protein n=1 Tax=Sphingomonas sp. Leaf208 TaxID=1735679 RepID=UPI0012E19B34|nr:hypothetical protein [Sphingomonas sp. Leaf208]